MTTEKIARYMWLGKRDVNWYDDCRQLFVELFGEGRLSLVAQLFAATSINTTLKSNVKLFRRALWEIENKKPIGSYLPNIQDQIARIRAGQEITGRKISNFAKAMQGDPLAVVVDVWICRTFDLETKKGVPKDSPTDKDYDVIEAYIRTEAKEMGLEARQLCAMIWAGVRTERTGDKQTHYKTILRYHLNNLYNVI